LEVEHEGTAASGGALVFDAAGMLLIGIGDDSVAPPTNPSASPARDRMDLRGSIVRVDVSGGGSGYAIPPDNPFVGDPDARPELFAIGLHDPQSCTTDLESGRTWCSDVGSGVRDELNLLSAGADFGWPIVEGFTCTLGECEPALHVGPHADYGLADPDAVQPHCQIRAGLGYRGDALPELQAVQLFGDRCSGRTYGVRTEGGAIEIVAAVAAGIATIGADASGEPWIVDGEGRLARLQLAPGGQPGTLPSALSQTGCFEDLVPSSPAPDVVPFLVASSLWSDGLLKHRFMVVPPGERVRVGVDGRWWFPEGSLLIKTFVLEATPGDPDSRRPIETRFMVRRHDAWEFHSYRWLDDGSDALLLDDDEIVSLQVHAREGVHEFEWTFPDEIGCRNCHGFATARALGPTTAQLNREVRYGEDPPTSQLAALAELDLLELEPDLSWDPASLPALTDPRDVEATLAERARAYMQANCAHCHRPGWMRPDLRVETPLAETGLCEAMEFPSPWVGGDARVVPGAPDQSNLWLRMGTRGKGQMPPLGTAVVDPLGHALLGEWITELERCE
ncbi:MAG TPA: PQQ-dependent sugar dehydrogenase, partial [Enhygromyxa sp.]|nr:PQQ-dependent sugar dehydrogenase [Enhygromyxa sp.]